MTESIISRVNRVLAGKIEDVVDLMERSGGDSVLREAIREADRAIDQLDAELETVTTQRLQAARQARLIEANCQKMTEKAKFAIDQGRDDLAEAAVVRQVDLEAEVVKLAKAQAASRDDEKLLEEAMIALKARKQGLEEALCAHLGGQSSDDDGESRDARGARRRAEKQVERAEKVFSRALFGCGSGFAKQDAETANRMAELDALHRSAEVAERLAALKQGDRR